MKFVFGVTFFLHVLVSQAWGCGWELRLLGYDHRPVVVESFDPLHPMGVTGSKEQVQRAYARLIAMKLAFTRLELGVAAEQPFPIALADRETRDRWEALQLGVGALGP